MLKILFTVLFCLAATVALSAQPVAEVTSIDGPGKLEVKSAPAAGWTRGFLEMEASVGNHLRTSPDTLASLEFILGGRANLDKGSEIAIVSPREIKVLTSGTFWGKFDTQAGDKPVTFKTAGGVMGIRGTEFVIEVDGDETTLSLLEGEVEIQPAQGESYTARPGSKVLFGRGRSLRAILMESEETLQTALERLRETEADLPADLEQALQNPQLRRRLIRQSRRRRELRDPRERWSEKEEALLEDDLRGRLDGAFFEMRRSLHEARRQLKQARVEIRRSRQEIQRGAREGEEGLEAAQRALEEAGLGSGQGTRRNQAGARRTQARLQRAQAALARLRRSNGTEPGEAETSTNPLEERPVHSSRPQLQWEPLPGSRFAVMILEGESGRRLRWLDYTTSNSYAYPGDAAQLPPGVYRCRVLPVDEDGRNPRQGIEYLFEVAP